jgi:hypothetical protein
MTEENSGNRTCISATTNSGYEGASDKLCLRLNMKQRSKWPSNLHSVDRRFDREMMKTVGTSDLISPTGMWGGKQEGLVGNLG